MVINRRDFVRLSGVAAVAASLPAGAFSPPRQLPTRPIPGTDERLSVIGLGNSQAFRESDGATSGRLLEIYTEHGGRYVDVSGSSGAFVGRLAQEMGATRQLFFGNYIDPAEESAMRDGVTALITAQGKPGLDLAHTRDLDGFRARHAVYRELQEDGLVRYVGIARTGKQNFEAMEQLIRDGLIDFIQVNYSMLEPEAGESLLPLAMDEGIAVAISRPFLNGNYFSVVSGHDLPAWAAEFDCESWAQFSLKFILSHPAVTCVLTETADLDHALDNLGAGFGELPDESTRKRMQNHMNALR
jgi:aryl-alcohol dehydrogenase-like predicted oxidoreductase